MCKATLLVVDDDRSFVEAISIFLEDHGFSTASAFGGLAGLTLLQRGPVDLAVVDVNLPDISGIELAERLHRAGRDVPLILISSDDGSDVQERCRAVGARSFLAKPLVPEELLDTISETLGKRS